MGREGKSFRRFGHYECVECDWEWTSAWTYCRRIIARGKNGRRRLIFRPLYRQECRHCGESIVAYRTEELKCPRCLNKSRHCTCGYHCPSCGQSPDECICEICQECEEPEEFCSCVHGQKPHRQDLCERCRNGVSCARRMPRRQGNCPC